MSVTFAYEATSIAVQNPDLQNVLSITKSQVVHRSAAGDRYCYDRGVDVMLMRLRWAELRDSEKQELESFFSDTANGVMNEFTYTDHRGAGWNAHFARPTIEFVEVADSQTGAASTFNSAGADYPTTTREAGVWAVEVVLEVEAAS